MALEDKKSNRQGRSAVPPQYRKKRRWLKILGSISLAVIISVGVVFLAIPSLTALLEEPQGNPNTAGTVPETPQPDQVIHLVAGGDVNVTDNTVMSGQTENGYDYSQCFRDILPILSQGDLTLMNLEGLVSDSAYGTATKTAPKQLLEALAKAGVDVLQTANSCSVFNGLRGLQNTLQAVRNAGMTPVGTFESNAAFDESGGYAIWEIQGIKVAVMGFTKGMDGMGLPAGSEHCVNLLYTDYNSTYQKVNTEGITQVVRNAAAHQPDIMVAMVHWGSEFNDQISKSQDQICRLLKSEGVDAIIGTHPHYVQKMEFDEQAGTFVAYSLGDLFGDGEISGTNYSVLLDLEITKDGTTGVAKITGFSYVPTFIEKDDSGKLQVLRIKEAIEGYENRFLGRVSEETYLAMKSALERIQSRTGVKLGG